MGKEAARAGNAEISVWETPQGAFDVSSGSTITSVVVNSASGFPKAFNGSSKRRVNVGAVAPLPTGETEGILELLSSPIAVESKFFNPDESPLEESAKITEHWTD